jgi:L-alanine-DL-glutamate epimerase-like enolase superfamily enzyme
MRDFAVETGCKPVLPWAMPKPTDVRPIASELFFLPVQTRVPLKFGTEVTTHVTVARVKLTVRSRDGRTASGWGETPLSVQWVWPAKLPYEERHTALKAFCVKLAEAWAEFHEHGHPMEVGHEFHEHALPDLLKWFNVEQRAGREPMPWLAALVCCSLFDLALHDAFGRLVERPVYATYNAGFMNRDLAAFLESAASRITHHASRTNPFTGKFPADFLIVNPPTRLRAWHLVGGLDPLDASELKGDEPDDGYPVLLADWIRRDGLKCLKVKLRGNDAAWDYLRLLKVGQLAIQHGVEWLTADFNCTVTEPAYVNDIVDRLRDEQPRNHGMILYVEQPFPYDLEANPIDAHSVSARKPLFLDESAHDWKLIRLGRELGWTGVALKTCKTQTGALLSACWAKAHGMTLMVQDLTNPMLAQISHCLLAAHVGTIMGVETNAMQFYPVASAPEAVVHPGLFQRRAGCVDLSTLRGPGFGYRLAEMTRELPPPVAAFGG